MKTCLSLFLLLWAATAHSHFVLELPTSIGFSDDEQSTGPCGGFSLSDRSQGVTNFPVGGISVASLTTHSRTVWTFKAALLNDTQAWRPLTPRLSQTGTGAFCEPIIPGLQEWVGRDAVLQVAQEAHGGSLYACSAVKFVAGPAAAVPSGCKNGTSIKATWL